MRVLLPGGGAFGWVLAACFALLFLLFYGTANIISAWVPWRIMPGLPFEAAWPLVPAWSLLYLSMPLMLLLGVWQLDWRAQWVLFATLLAQLLLACVCFVLLPVQLAFEPETVVGVWRWWHTLAMAVGMSQNHLPSLHMAFAATAVWALWPVVRWWARWGLLLWAMLVAISTLLIHAHHLLDLVAGMVLAVSMWLTVAPWARQSTVLRRVRLGWLWCCNQYWFARRHRRYALIALLIAWQRVRSPTRGTLMLSGFCFLQAVDDVMDGDRLLLTEALPWVDGLMSAWQAGVFDESDDTLLMAADFYQRLAMLADVNTVRGKVWHLLAVMREDYIRSSTQAVWSEQRLAAQHQATFALSLDVLLSVLASSLRAKDVPELVSVLGWCSVMRDMREDVAAGLINVPDEVWNMLPTTCADEGTTPDKVTQWCHHPAWCLWMQVQHQHALSMLQALDKRIDKAQWDASGERVVRMFARSVAAFAHRRFFRLYPSLGTKS